MHSCAKVTLVVKCCNKLGLSCAKLRPDEASYLLAIG